MKRDGALGRLLCFVGCHHWRPVVIDLNDGARSFRRCRRCKLQVRGKWW